MAYLEDRKLKNGSMSYLARVRMPGIVGAD
jgi:hypothetical protein